CLAAYWATIAASWLILRMIALALSAFNELMREPSFLEVARFLLFLANIVVPTWLQIGLNLSLLKAARRERTTFENLFRGGRYLLTTLLATLFFWAIAGLAPLLVHGLASLLQSEFPVLTTFLGALPVLAVAGAPESILEGIFRTILSGFADSEL